MSKLKDVGIIKTS